MSVPNEPPYLYLTTVGRKTGLPREIEIWYTQIADCYYLIAEHGEQSHWVRNIRQTPQISFRLGPATFNGLGRILERGQDATRWQAVSARFAQKYGWNEGLIVELKPLPD